MNAVTAGRQRPGRPVATDLVAAHQAVQDDFLLVGYQDLVPKAARRFYRCPDLNPIFSVRTSIVRLLTQGVASLTLQRNRSTALHR